MMKKMLFFKIQLLIFLPALTLNAQDVEVIITGIRAEKGQIVIGVFKDNESFRKEESFLEKRFVKNGISNGEMRVKFSLEPGIYGLSLLDDENSDGKMEYSFARLPKEGFGFSDYYHTGLTRPKFDSFKFSIDQSRKRTITVRIRYL
jgi:uncharacterized protein (DUF2141 family)